MISSFRHKGLLAFFNEDDHSGVPVKLAPRISRILDRLDACTKPQDMDLPGYNLHPLKGQRKDCWSVTVNGNWRMTFIFDDGDAYIVNYEDYH